MPRPWTKADLAIVRKLPPREAAKLSGHPLSSVYAWRFKLKLPDRRHVRFFQWTPAADQTIRSNSPPVAAKLLKLGTSTIHRRRKFLGLGPWQWPRKPKPKRKTKSPRWTAREDRIVRTHSPREAAKLTGRSMSAVYMRRFWKFSGRVRLTTKSK